MSDLNTTKPARKRVRTNQKHISISGHVYELLVAHRDKTGTPISNTVEKLVTEYLEQHAQ